MKRVFLMVALVLLGSSGAWALTKADTTISNSASLTYSAGGVDQTNNGNSPITSNTDTFKVDKKIDFTLTNDDGDQVIDNVVPSAQDINTTWKLVNIGNMDQNFTLESANLTNNESIYNDSDSGQDTGTQTIYYSKGNGATWQTYNGQFVIKGDHSGNTQSDRTVLIRVGSNIPPTVHNGNVMNISLKATAVDSTGAKEVNSAGQDVQGQMDIVLAEGKGDDTVNDDDHDAVMIRWGGYKVTTAVLDLTKNSCVYSDPVTNSGSANINAKRIPGAFITYVLDINNTGSLDATDIVIEDNIDSNNFVYTHASDAKEVYIDTNATECKCNNGVNHGQNTSGTGSTGTNTGTPPKLKIENIGVGASKHTCVSFRLEIK